MEYQQSVEQQEAPRDLSASSQDDGGSLSVARDQLAQASDPADDNPVLEMAEAEALAHTAGMRAKLEQKLFSKYTRDNSSVRDLRADSDVGDSADAGAQLGLAGSPRQQSDVAQHSGQHADKGKEAAIHQTIERIADDKVTDLYRRIVTQFMFTAGVQGDGFQARLKVAKKGAAKLASEGFAAAKDDLPQALTQAKDDVEQRAQVESLAAASEEMQRRVDSNEDVRGAVDQAGVVELVKQVEGSLLVYLKKKIGADGARRWRSSQLKSFRGRMKDAGRDQAKEDATDQTAQLAAGPATKRFVEMDAHRRTYDPAKSSVNDALAEVAQDGATASIAYIGAPELFRTAASKAAWEVLNAKATDTTNANKKAKSAASGVVKAVKAEGEAFAHKWKDKLIGKSNDDMGQDAPPSEHDVGEQVQQKVSDDGVGGKAVSAAYKAANTDEAMGWVAKIIDKAVPGTGDFISLSVEVQIPIPNTPGVFILVGIAGSARRGDGGAMMPGARNHSGDDSVETNLEVKFGAGVEMIGLKADASLIFFIRSGAENAGKCTKAMSYGVYRAVSRRSEKLARVWAGSGKGTDKDVNERSEAWAGMMEEQIFLENPDAYAEIGMAIEGRAGVSINDDLGIAATVRAEARNHYDRDVIMAGLGIDVSEDVSSDEVDAQRTDQDDGKGKKRARRVLTGVNPKKQAKRDIVEQRKQDALRAHLADDDNFEGQGAKERRQKVGGQMQKGLVFSVTVTADIGGQKVAFSGTLSYAQRDSWEVEIAASITMEMGDSTAMEQLIAGVIGGSLTATKALVSVIKSGVKDDEGRAVSAGTDMVSSAGQIANAGTGDAIGKALTGIYKVDETASDLNLGDEAADLGTKGGMSSSVGLKVALFFGNTGSGPKGGIEVSEVSSKSLALSAGGVGINVAYSKGHTLLQAGHDGERNFLEVMGMSTKNA